MAAKKGGGRPRTGKPGSRVNGGRPGATGRRPETVGGKSPRNAPAQPVVAPNKIMVATAPWLTRLSALPRLVVPAVVAGLILGGLAAGGVVGLLCLLVVAAFLGWFLAAFWPVTPVPGRVLRAAAIVAVVLVAIAQTR